MFKKVTSCVLSLFIIITVFACAGETDEPDNGSDITEETTNEPIIYDPTDSATADVEADSEIVSISNGVPLVYTLPAPNTDGAISVESALANRRSHRSFQDKALSQEQLSQILWSAYGVTLPRPASPAQRGGLRTAPSAGALYPLEIYAIIGNVDGIEPGVYRYDSGEHSIKQLIAGDVRAELSAAALNQSMVREAPLTVFYSAIFNRTTDRYGERGVLYVYIEVGHSAQNVYLQVEAMGLGTCAIGAFTDDTVRELLNLPAEEEPLYLMPVGYIS